MHDVRTLCDVTEGPEDACLDKKDKLFSLLSGSEKQNLQTVDLFFLELPALDLATKTKFCAAVGDVT